MWFARKAKNRVFERKHVLDVKLRSSQVRKARVRVATVGISVSLATIFGLYVLWRSGEWMLDRWVYQNRSFALREMDIETDGVIAREQIQRWAGVKANDNLFALDLARIKRDLELVPAIEVAIVDRILPHTLRVRVTEREPIARIIVPNLQNAAEPQVFLLDARGHVMLPLETRQRAVPPLPGEHLPQISGIHSSDLRPGRVLDSGQVRGALRFIQAFEDSPMASLVDVVRIEVSNPEVLQVVTDQQNELTFSLREFERQLNRWRVVYEKGQQLGKQIGWLDLSVTENVPLRWQESGTLPPTTPTPKVRKPSLYKKKHV